MNFNAPYIDYAGISPVIALTAGIVVGAARRPRRRGTRHGCSPPRSSFSPSARPPAVVWQFGEPKDLVGGALRLGRALDGDLADLIASAAFVIPLSWREGAFDGIEGPAGHGEFQALLLSSVLGMVLLAQATNLVSFFVGLELLSIPLYVMCGSALARRRSLESGLKYLVVGSLGSATLLYGLAFIYGASGSTDFDGDPRGDRVGPRRRPAGADRDRAGGRGPRVQALGRARSTSGRPTCTRAPPPR